MIGGVAFYVYTSSSDTAKEAGSAARSGAQAVKVAANFVPTKADYQKVRVHLTGRGIFPSIQFNTANVCRSPSAQVYNKIAEVIDSAEGYDG